MVRYFRSLFVISLLIVGLLGILFVSAVISNDRDSDGFSDAIEQYVGTNPNLSCGINAWPPDFNNNNITSLSDVLMFIPSFNSIDGQQNYNRRFDLNTDGKVTLQDVLRMQLYFNHKCSDFVGCFNGVKDGSESYIDCGGTCPTKCNAGNTCNANSDCVSGLNCQNGYCTSPQSCTDSDGGTNLDLKGIVNVSNSTGSVILYDSCYSYNSINERYCNGFQAVTIAGAGCSMGKNCIDGACSIPTSCTDTDAGINYNQLGTVTISNSNGANTFTDKCSGESTTLQEYSCSSGVAALTWYTCPSGNACVNGACVTQSNFTSCSDSDGGQNTNVRGTVNTTNSTGNFTFTDVCNSSSTVREYYCDTSGNNSAEYTIWNCNLGYTCSNGACIASQQNSSCTDSDGGINAGLNGTLYFVNAQGGGKLYYDTCGNVTNGLPNTTLIEYYCNGSTGFGTVNISCTSGFPQGKCYALNPWSGANCI